MPVDQDLIRTVHRHIVTGCDDDHCPPGELRGPEQNVAFGQPRHRGVDGGAQCKKALDQLCQSVRDEFPGHDPFIQALSLHYHLAAMHPFLDGNGRTARALEAVLLQRSRLKRELFIAMSNYYYDEKHAYLATLAEVRASEYDLTPFLKFGLRGIASQCQRLLGEIRTQLEKTLFRDVMHQMFGRLRTSRKRVMAKRQLEILSVLLDRDPTNQWKLLSSIDSIYGDLRAPGKAWVRDLTYLYQLGAIRVELKDRDIYLSARLEWATEITETKFFEEMNKLPKAKTLAALR
jgi:Fic family protein